MVVSPETMRLNPARNGGCDTTAINPHCRGVHWRTASRARESPSSATSGAMHVLLDQLAVITQSFSATTSSSIATTASFNAPIRRRTLRRVVRSLVGSLRIE